MRHTAWRWAAALVVWTLLGAASAGAEPIVTMGPGTAPSAVTDAAGTLHVVWREARTSRLLYCRVPAGGGPCIPVQLAGSGGAPHLMLRPQDGALIVVSLIVDDALGGDATGLVTSVDGGTTWSPQRSVGSGMHDLSDAALSPDGAFVSTVGTGNLTIAYQRVPLAGGIEQRVVNVGPWKSVNSPRVTNLPDGRPVVIGHFTDSERLGARAPAPGVDPDDPAAWAQVPRWRTVRNADDSAGDVGPTGTWLLTEIERGGDNPVRIWRWGSRGFAHPRTIGALARRAGGNLGATADTGSVALDVDLAGRLHAAWPLDRRECGGQECLVYRRTDRRGFGPPIVYPLGRTNFATPDNFVIAANSGGSGWLVWNDLFDQVRAVPLVTPPRGSRVGSRRIGHRRVTVPDFYGCVPPGGTFVHRLRVDGLRGARIVSVRFFFDAGQPARTDHRAPYRISFRLGFPAGSRHVAGAIVRYRLPGEARVRSVRLGRTFVMC